MVKFSVIIPNLNSPVIHLTLKALIAQEFESSEYEILVVGKDEPNLIFQNELVSFDHTDQPLWAGPARNRGVRQTRGTILAFTDGDCIPNPDWLSELSFCFDNSDVSVVGGGVEFDTKNYWTTSDNLSMFYDYHSSHSPGKRKLLPSLNLAIRREVFEVVGGFDETRIFSEDSDISIRLRKAGYDLFFQPEAIVKHIPPRIRFLDMIRHSYGQGMHSTKVDPKYREEDGIRGVMGSQLGLILFSPVLAAGVLCRIFTYPNLRKFWLTAPAIYLSKLAWCFGAAKHFSRQ